MDSNNALKIEVPYSEKISRLFIFRPLWVCILIFPLIAAGIWQYILTVVQFLHMLFLGKRNKGMFDQQARFFAWMKQWQSDLGNYTDMKPGFWY